MCMLLCLFRDFIPARPWCSALALRVVRTERPSMRIEMITDLGEGPGTCLAVLSRIEIGRRCDSKKMVQRIWKF